MSAPPQRLSLPEGFLLLSHLDSGKLHSVVQTAMGCAAAELGELALQQRLLVRTRKARVADFEVLRGHGHIEVFNTAPTGLGWADAVLAELEHRAAASDRPVVLYKWLKGRHREAFALHRRALTERGALRHQPTRLLGRDRHYPDPALRTALVHAARTANNQQALDEHSLFLCDLLHGAELMKDLGLKLSLSQRLDRGRGIGAVAVFPEELRDTSAILGMAVPTRHGG